MQDVLRAALEAAGLSLDVRVIEALSEYAEFVLAANATQNLTALRSPELFAAEGIVDSLLALSAIGGKNVTSVVDIGSGSGLPALVWLCAGRLERATLIEAERRKSEFLQSAAAALHVPAEVVWGRAEELARGVQRDRAMLVTARALAPAPIAIEVCGGLVRPGGRLALLKGPRADAEEREASPVAARMGFGPAQPLRYVLPSGAERTVLVYRKLRPTPEGRPQGFARLRREFPAKPAGPGKREGAAQGE